MTTWKWFSLETDPLIFGLKDELVNLIDEGRSWAGVTFTLTSGVRSEIRNSMAGGVADSAHLSGKACDLHVEDSNHLFKMVDGLLQAGARRLVIGIRIEDGKVVYHNLHVDIDYDKPTPILSIKLYGTPEA